MTVADEVHVVNHVLPSPLLKDAMAVLIVVITPLESDAIALPGIQITAVMTNAHAAILKANTLSPYGCGQSPAKG